MAKNANNKVNRWGMELSTYNITFEWISGACNRAADCLLCLVELPEDRRVLINVLSVTNTDGPAFNTRSQTHQCLSPDISTSWPDVMPEVQQLQILHQNSLQRIDYKLSCRCRKLIPSANEYPNIYQTEKHLSMKLIYLFIHVRGLLYNMSLLLIKNS